MLKNSLERCRNKVF